MLRNVVACILAGGEGKRLWPLTAHRAIIDRGIVVPPGARIGEAPAGDATHVTVSAGGIRFMGYPPPHQTPTVVWS